MISIRDAEEILKKEYHIDNFTYLVKEQLLPDYISDKHEVVFDTSIFSKVTQLGISTQCDITVFEVILIEGANNRRVAITQEMFRILRGLRINNALVAFSNSDGKNYRISLLTSKYEYDGDKLVKIVSNPRRYSYALGFGTKTKTAYKYLIEKGKVSSLDDLTSRFSVEVVNKQFYSEIALCFTELVGGERDGKKFDKKLNLYSVTNQNKYAEFAVRLIGRVMFCWFLKEKKSEQNISLVPDSLLSLSSVIGDNSYYHDVLEPLFFELLNTNQNRRRDKFGKEDIYKQIPYLNGGLFSPHADDLYKYSAATQSGAYGIVNIPNSWFHHFFEVLSQYNFTVDENTSYDIELSIDPEMLGRIFENLLAEINPETGENAKKSTGSFYTPRDIVDYMVDSSLFEYLKEKTTIAEEKLKALISYGKEDDELAVLDAKDKKSLINALYTITILDPACGSGAFPIGMLQKIVYILQEIDPGATLWFDKATENVGILLKKEFEKKFNAGSLDYIRKLSVIQNSIFGVDIQPIAVDIARLRCFLSLVIEEKVDDKEENRGINPLPNLDFKIICANTLISLDNNAQMSLFENQTYIDELKAVREEYFNSDSARRSELKLEFAEIQKKMYQDTIDNYKKIASSRYAELSRWSPFSNDLTGWFDPEWMFGIKDGFDIVIANPPYGANIDSMLNVYRKIYYVSNKSYAEIYKMFYHRGLELLKNNGMLCYITPNTYLSQPRYKDLRQYLLHYNFLEIINLGEGVFEEVIVPVCITLITKAPATKTFLMKDIRAKSNFSGNFLLNDFSIISLEDVKKYVDLNLYQMQLKSDGLVFDDVFVIKDAGIQYHRSNIGLKNKGGNDLFERIIGNDEKCFLHTVPVWYGKLVKKYSICCTDEYFNLDYKNVLKQNETVSFSLDAFLMPERIIWRQTASCPICTIDFNKRWFRNTIQCAWIREQYKNAISIYSALAIFNSKYIKYRYNLLVQENGRVFPQIKITHLKKMPIRVPNNEWNKIVEEKVKLILDKKTHDERFEINKEEKEIDNLVYKLYELTDEEIAIVEAIK